MNGAPSAPSGWGRGVVGLWSLGTFTEEPDQEGHFLTWLRALSKPSPEQSPAFSAVLGDSIQRVLNCMQGDRAFRRLQLHSAWLPCALSQTSVYSAQVGSLHSQKSVAGGLAKRDPDVMTRAG